ncbi:hypothetical protein TWF281_001405 [Arthrobotrys megalospora]
MSGFEIAGVALGAPAVVELLIKASIKGYHVFQSAQSTGTDIQRYQYELRVMCVELEEWANQLKLLGGDLGAILGMTSLRYRTTLDTLAMITSVFVEVDQLNKKYGITYENPDNHQIQNVRSPLPSPASVQNRTSWFYRTKPGSKTSVKATSVSTLVATSINSLPLLQRSGSNSPSDRINLLQTFSNEVNLDIQVTGLDEHINKLGITARQYHETLTTMQRYKWAFYNSDRLELLINDLKLYTSYLHKLTKTNFNSTVPTIHAQPSAPSNEFSVPFVPSHPLASNFCGRVEQLMIMESRLSLSEPTTKPRHQRVIINLHGMGGIGKSQLARYFVEVNKGSYTGILWVHAADPGTIDTSARRILKELIAHYATEYDGGPNFTTIARNLRIPGQIDSLGEPTGDAAQNPWRCIQNWMMREGNSQWCLVLDSVDTESDLCRAIELLPPCAYGHVIITSRIRVPDAEIITVPELDKASSITLLLGDKTGDVVSAERVAEMLGYLPIALSQAAAYVKKRGLGFTQYLDRLAGDRTRLLGAAHAKYPQGVFSCWKLSVDALMISNPNAIDLLRICSFLSPDGVPEELLNLGVDAIDWARNDKSRLDEAIDDLVIYSLGTRKSSSTTNGTQSFWIHPLVQLWARDSYFEANSVTLEEDKERLAELHARGARAAICLVGYSVREQSRSKTRKQSHWVYERENMPHFNLCTNRYITEWGVISKDEKDTKLASALSHLSMFKDRWGEHRAAIEILKITAQVYENMLPEDPSVEYDLLITRQNLNTTYLLWNWLNSDREDDDLCPNLEDICRDSEEALQRLKIIRPNDYVAIFFGETVLASYYQERGDFHEALEKYDHCLELWSRARAQTSELTRTPPTQNDYISLLHGYATVHYQLNEYDKAEKLYDQCIELSRENYELYSQGTHTTFYNAGMLKLERGKYLEARTCLIEGVKFAEEMFGLSHHLTLDLLRSLQKTYVYPSDLEEAEAIEKKIVEAEAALEPSGRLIGGNSMEFPKDSHPPDGGVVKSPTDLRTLPSKQPETTKTGHLQFRLISGLRNQLKSSIFSKRKSRRLP